MVKAGKFGKEIQLEYSFDRLSANKIAQAYQLLVAERMWVRGEIEEGGENQGEGKECKDSRDVRASFLGATERRTNHW